MQFARVRQLAQTVVTTASGATTVFTGTADVTEITRIEMVFPAGAGTADLYHDDDGTTYAAATQIAVIASTQHATIESPAVGSGIGVTAGGSLAVDAATNDCTVTVYGIVETLPEEA